MQETVNNANVKMIKRLEQSPLLGRGVLPGGEGLAGRRHRGLRVPRPHVRHLAQHWARHWVGDWEGRPGLCSQPFSIDWQTFWVDVLLSSDSSLTISLVSEEREGRHHSVSTHSIEDPSSIADYVDCHHNIGLICGVIYLKQHFSHLYCLCFLLIIITRKKINNKLARSGDSYSRNICLYVNLLLRKLKVEFPVQCHSRDVVTLIDPIENEKGGRIGGNRNRKKWLIKWWSTCTLSLFFPSALAES